jgi:hypothetical protein
MKGNEGLRATYEAMTTGLIASIGVFLSIAVAYQLSLPSQPDSYLSIHAERRSGVQSVQIADRSPASAQALTAWEHV